MRVAMKDGAHTVPVDGLLEPAGPEIWKYFRRLAFDCRANRRVVQQRHAARRPQARERRLQLQRFVDRFLHEGFDGPLPPWTERAPAETAAKPLHTRKT